MAKKRKILAVTGSRSDYDLLSPVYERLHKEKDIDFSIIVTGAHLSEKFGLTEDFIIKDGYRIADKVYNLVDSNRKIGRAISLGNQIPAFAHIFEREKPDIILIAGDREEALSVTTTAAYMSFACAHFFGGDITYDGNVDNSVRYAASKLAHIHFPVMQKHKETLLKLGEDDWRIFVSGSPALDKFIKTPVISRKQLTDKLKFDITRDKYLLLIQHPIINEVDEQYANIKCTLDAIVKSGFKCMINYPNSDAGNHSIIKAYHEYAARFPQLFLFTNLSREIYVNLMRHTICLVGNSSSGICEAPSLGLPAVNVGTRQRGRIHGNNVIFTAYDEKEILKAIIKSTSDKDYIKKVKKGKNPYGDGRSAEKIVKVLHDIEINDKLIYKNITYK
jgi:GDP/UDP-N,N'-diacetylbacillosamine 2-epimerase (hydrolysing)